MYSLVLHVHTVMKYAVCRVIENYMLLGMNKLYNLSLYAENYTLFRLLVVVFSLVQYCK